jgi:hypothetical protein
LSTAKVARLQSLFSEVDIGKISPPTGLLFLAFNLLAKLFLCIALLFCNDSLLPLRSLSPRCPQSEPTAAQCRCHHYPGDRCSGGEGEFVPSNELL